MVRTGNLFPARLRASHQNRRQNNNYRRNGKLQACEPCRKGKLRCDHMMPTCGRCARRGKPEQCIYHPAPLTKMTTTPTPQHTTSDQSSPEINNLDYVHDKRQFALVPSFGGSEATRRRELSSPRLSMQPCHYDEISTPTTHQVNLSGTSCSDHCIQPDALSFDNKSAFINHSAVLAENEGSIGIQPQSSGFVPISKISQAHIDRGAAVLRLLKDFPTIQKYIDKWFSFAGGIIVIEPMVKLYTTGLWSTWQKTLESQKPTDLALMSEKIWENTLRPASRLLSQHTTPREFCTNVTGGLLRWEIVGIIVTLVSLIAQSLKDGDPIFVATMKAPLIVLHWHSKCVTRRKCYETSKKISTLATALLSCNLHQEITIDDQTPFFIAEFRKRLFICTYEHDKKLAASSGKPPKLTRHYCRLQIPFDITDAQIMSEGLDLDTAVDSNGWNQRGVVHRCTFARLSAANALIVEEILEISLGDLSQDELVRRATEIQVKTNKNWEDLPEFLQVDINELWSSKHSPLELLFLVDIRLRHLDHHFLLQRTLSKKLGLGSTDSSVNLLLVCSEIFGLVVLMVDHKDHFRDFQVDFVSILIVHGIPTAAVLAVELLHQEQNATSAPTIAYPLHRSDTVQSLSVFVSCLGTIRKETNGFESCDRGRKFLKRILDMILGPGPAAPRHSLLNMNDSDDPTLGAPLSQTTSDGDFVRWLEGMEWDHDSLVNFNGIQ